MALKFTTTTAEARIHGVKITVYGRSGIGKTVLARTAPPPCVILAAEPGLLSLAEANQRRLFGDYLDIDVWQVTELSDLNQALTLLERADCPYVTVFVDSITEIGETILANALKQVSDPRQAYGELMEKMTATLKAFRDLPGKHVIFVAKQAANKDGCTPLEIPAMPGSKVGPAIPYLMDEVFHMDIGELPDGSTYRFLRTQPSVQFDAKDRSGALEPVEEPHLGKLISKIVS